MRKSWQRCFGISIGACAAALGLVLSVPLAAQDRAAARKILVEAQAAEARNDTRAARVLLLNAIKTDPNFVDARLAQARIVLKLGDGLSAESELRRALALKAPEDQVRAMMVHAILMQNEPERALQFAAAGPTIEQDRGYLGRISGAAHLALGNLGAAAREFDFAVSRMPDNSDLWTDIARFRRINQDRIGAFAAINLAIDRDPKNVAAITLKAEMVREVDGLAQSLPVFRQALAVDPKFVPALLEYGATLGDLGQYHAMLQQVRAAFEVNKNIPRGYYLQAVLAARAGDYPLARALMQRTRGKMDGVPGYMLLSAVVELQMGGPVLSADWSEKLLAAQPDNLKARELFAIATFVDGDFDDAFAAILPIVERRDANSWSLLLAARSMEHMPYDNADPGTAKQYADILERAASLNKAIAAPLSSRQDRTNSADAISVVMQVRAQIGAGNTAGALSSAQSLQARANSVPDAHILAGDAALATNNPALAKSAFEKAAAIRRDEGVALRLILANLLANKPDEAQNIVRFYLQQYPGSIGLKRVAANLALDRRDWALAQTYLSRLIDDTNARDVIVLRQMGLTWLELRDPRRAYPYLLRAYRLQPANAETSSLLSLAIAQRGNNSKAAIDLQAKAVAMMPDNRIYQDRLAGMKRGKRMKPPK